MRNQEDAIQEAMRLARTPAGQKLIQTLQQHGGNELQNSLQQAKSGDTRQIQQILNRFMDDPDVRQLMDQLMG